MGALNENILSISILVVLLSQIVLTLPNPSYTSEWEVIKSQSSTQSEIVFNHNLNQVPIKVLTEVKVQINNEYFNFPGMGSGTCDDDKDIKYGGVLTTFDKSSVTLYAPNRHNHFYSGLVLYTGTDGWIGPSNVSNREFSEANVRVKVWIRADFPNPDFETSWENISVYDSETFREVQHNLNGYPTFSVVQIKAENYYFEAQGSSSRDEFLKSPPENAGGIIFGFSDESFRIWYPRIVQEGSDQTAILSIWDGWGTGRQISNQEAEYRILAWKFSDIGRTTIELSKTELIRSDYQMFQMELNSTSVNVEVQSTDGVNRGYRFYGVGSTVNDGDRGPYGGLIYAYNDRKILFWMPNGTDGHLINIGGSWGPQTTHQSTDNVTIRVNIFDSWVTEKTAFYQVSQSHSNILPSSDIIWTKSASFIQCARYCTNDLYCNSFFVHATDGLCFGYSYDTFSTVLANSYIGMVHYINIK